jgi:hypothetical protein
MTCTRSPASWPPASVAGGSKTREMQQQGAMVHYCRRLDTAVAICTIEIQCVGTTLVARVIIDRFGCVISHSIIVVTLRVRALGNRCATLEREAFSLVGSPDSNSKVWKGSLWIPDCAL